MDFGWNLVWICLEFGWSSADFGLVVGWYVGGILAVLWLEFEIFVEIWAQFGGTISPRWWAEQREETSFGN